MELQKKELVLLGIFERWKFILIKYWYKTTLNL